MLRSPQLGCQPFVRATEFHFDCPSRLADTLSQAEARELELVCADGLSDGDWIMVTVRVAEDATCLAGRVVAREGTDGTFGVEFAEHDWRRLLDFAARKTTRVPDPQSRQTPPCSVCPPCDANVLIVHDDPTVADMLGRMLGSHGFCATWVSTPGEALEALRAKKVDLVLAEWSPRGMAGQEFCAELKSQCVSCATPRPSLVFLACPSARAERPVALEAGADDFVVLPFRWRELDARLLSLLHRPAAP